METEDNDAETDLTDHSETSEQTPTVLSDLLSKSDLSDSEKDDITINLTEASHDDPKDPDLLDSLGLDLTTKIDKVNYFTEFSSTEFFL